MDGWIAKNWKNAAKKPVKIKEMWEELDVQISKHSIRWKWVKGHDGNEHNEMADFIARRYIEQR